ncbi:conserved unknown protein [Ectocarpus siliculosus]|uniref:tRNA (adenine(58)-N(1))-methyltransferase n=1 Tax=Ectocarpus siliculosus TaxID=2880 RepID=D7G6P6_ECTSI|nr:conserved unknown protein [Ectocarpus siliculosus]|eukprot:CBJ27631.1 conserved unknown protein [Ectocarpus siliculosus]
MDFRAGRCSDGSRDPATICEASTAPLIRNGDMVVFFEGREPIGFDRMKAKTIWQCRHGAFHHDEIIGKPFGSRVFSRTTKGYVYALSPTPELWSHVVPNRTQIVQDFDQSIVIFRLDLKPGDTVVESGTGSGVMSTAIMRTIAPSGFLHSFEFNEFRATRAQEEFEENALGGLVKAVHRDVCAARGDGGGFGEELDGKADAVFLDLPEPWLAVAHAKMTLKPGKKLCSYSPCIEQVMKTCEALRSEGFHSVSTIEFRLRNINYAEVEGIKPMEGDQAALPGSKKRSREEGGGSGAATPGVDDGASRTGRGRNERLQPKAAIRAAEAAAEKVGGARKPPLKLVCAQPFPLMRGHTAFLTFATAPVSRQLGTAATAEATAAASGAPAGGATSDGVDGSEDGHKAGIAGDAEIALNRSEGDASGGGGGGGGGSGDRMDVCEEGIDGKGKGKGKGTDADKTDDSPGASASDVVPETPDSSSPAGR